MKTDEAKRKQKPQICKPRQYSKTSLNKREESEFSAFNMNHLMFNTCPNKCIISTLKKIVK